MKRIIITFLFLCFLSKWGFGEGIEDIPEKLRPFFKQMEQAKLDDNQVLIFNNGTDPKTLDPAIMTGAPENYLALALFEGLVTSHPETLEACPGVARAWDISKDGLVYTFYLRNNACWSNKDPVTAEDFVLSWERVLDPKTGSQYANQLYRIKNGKAYHTGSIPSGLESFKKHVGVEAIDRLTLKVTLESPTQYFLDLCSYQTLMPVHIKTVQKYKDRWTRPENIVSNGPFVLKEWSPRARIVMERNPYYWMDGLIKLKKIIAYPLEDLNTAYNKYLANEVDWLTAVPIQRINEIKKNPDFRVSSYLAVSFYRFNVTRPPFNDSRVRAAFSMAVDRVHLCQFILKVGEIPAYTYVPPGLEVFGYKSPEGLPYNPEAARELLADAGYPGGKGFPKVNLLFNTSESNKLIAEKITQMWQRILGVTVGLENMEWKVFLERTKMLDYQICRGSWLGDYLDPNTFMDIFVTGNGNNGTGFSNKEYDSLIEKAATEVITEKRMSYFRRAEEILCEEEIPIIPLWFYVNRMILRPKVKGIYSNIRDVHPYQYIYIIKE